MPGRVDIQSISAAQTWPIRQAVMWPWKPVSFVQLPQDEAGLHLGLFLDQQLVSVVSLFLHQQEAQFRKFATLQAFQRQGFANLLLEQVFELARKQGIKNIWCHARCSARPFYQRHGMISTGEGFERQGVEYVRMEKII